MRYAIGYYKGFYRIWDWVKLEYTPYIYSTETEAKNKCDELNVILYKK